MSEGGVPKLLEGNDTSVSSAEPEAVIVSLRKKEEVENEEPPKDETIHIIPQKDEESPAATEPRPVANDESKSFATKQKRKIRKRRGRRRKRKAFESDSEDERLKNHLLKRTYAKEKLAKNDGLREPVLKRKNDGGFEVVNPVGYDKLMTRLEDAYANKPNKPTDGQFIDGPSSCALCGMKQWAHQLGDLFGPYYVRLDFQCWPPFLKKTRSAMPRIPQNEDTFIDLWFHCNCLVWAPNIFLKRDKLIGIEDNLKQFWKQV
ncbi:unnamed protein product [Soboliphyme baturini]|uniref:PARP-type domain-containing protein n=1 Tax=Soboliphyme baturini TaxID=241478 RepID=A0A183IX44_9BILA|nr:unnamed protein product [Soboliphyme baturini]